MTRIYTAQRGNRVRSVRLEETYEGSQHWRVFITPEGYGANPAEITFCSDNNDGDFYQQTEGYGIFRLEMAAFIAAQLTNTTNWTPAT